LPEKNAGETDVILETMVVGPLAMNTYLVGCPESREAVVVDPGDEPEKILGAIDRHQLKLRYILLTHAHFDHIGAVAGVKEATGAVVMIHKDEQIIVDNLPLQTSLFGFPQPSEFAVDRWLKHDEVIFFGALRIKVLATPGHTPGGVCFLLNDLLYSGDTLFCESIGRTDLPGGSQVKLLKSIHEQLWPLSGATQVYPGHGPATTISHEKRYNPFLIG
jgi:hydroxyacylglutathione hydrolase